MTPQHESLDREWIITQYHQQRAMGASAREAWSAVKNQFTNEYKSGNAEQAWKNYSGKAFENIIEIEFQNQLQKNKINQQIAVSRWNQLKKIG